MSNIVMGAREQVSSVIAPFFEKHPMVANGLSRLGLMMFTFFCMSIIISWSSTYQRAILQQQRLPSCNLWGKPLTLV